MLFPELPPSIDTPKEFCFCGRKTVEFHEFLFCSSDCARQDSLRSLRNPGCHYRDAVRQAYAQAGVREPKPRRMASAFHLRPQAGHYGRHPFAAATPPPQPINADLARIAPWTVFENNTVPFPTDSSMDPTMMPAPGRSRREDFANEASRGHPMMGYDQAFRPYLPSAFPLPQHPSARPLRRVPSALVGNKKSSVATLLGFGRSRKGKEVENPEREFGHPVNKGRFF